jgi:hypothetical protein
MVSCLLVIDSYLLVHSRYFNEFLFLKIILGPPEQAMWALGKDDDKIFIFVYL